MRLLLPLALLVLVAPSVAADHVYSHRFVFEGRLLGSDGLPLPGRTVAFFADGDDFLEACQGGHAPVTDEWGDFRFCFHKHGLDVQTQVGARVGNASLLRPMDTAFRRTVVTLNEPNETGTAPLNWSVSHLVAGRVWRHGPQELEGVRVYGLAIAHVPVNVTLRIGEVNGSRFEVETDGYGDFRLPIELLEETAPENVTVEVEVLGHRQSRTLDATHRITVGFILPAEGEAGIPTFDPFVREGHPGTTTPRVTPALFAAGALGLVVAVLMARRQK